MLCKKKIEKSQPLATLECDVPTDAQKQYAAMDAWACLRIFTLLKQLSQSGDFEIAPLKEKEIK